MTVSENTHRNKYLVREKLENEKFELMSYEYLIDTYILKIQKLVTVDIICNPLFKNVKRLINHTVLKLQGD